MARLRLPNAVNPASIDHAGLGALDSDDHTQYHTNARGDARYGYVAEVTLTTSQVKALNGTPITLVAAPGATKALILQGAELWLDYETTAYDGIAAGEDVAIRYTDGSGSIMATVEATGFLDATADDVRWVYPTTTAAITPVANAALVAHMTSGNIATGDSPLKVRVYYRVIDMSW